MTETVSRGETGHEDANVRDGLAERSNPYTAALASFAAGITYAEIPAPVVEHVKVCVLDTIGCALYGSTLPWSKILLTTADVLGTPGGVCTVWGTDQRLPAAEAALVNGTAVHSMELDDLHQHSILHPGSVVLPAALALLEHAGGASGRRLIEAVVAGYEVGARAGMSVGAAHLVQGWHPTGTHGTLGAAGAAGRMLGLSPDQMVHAFGIAGSQASGLMASQYAAMVKRLHAGRASQSGVYAAVLAQRGFTGITDLFESPYGGYCSTFSPTYDLDKIVNGLGETWEVAKVGFKPYSTNGSCHTTIDALLELRRDHHLTLDDVEAIVVHASTATAKHVGWRYVPESVTTAQMNLSYIAAVTLADGAAFVEQFREDRIRDPRLVAAAQRVTVQADPDIDARGDAGRHNVRLELRLTDGTVLHAARDYARGSARSPLTLADVNDKFDRLARTVLDPAQVARVRDLVDRLDEIEDARQLADALRP